MDTLIIKINEAYSELKKEIEVEKNKNIKLNELIDKNEKLVANLKEREIVISAQEKKYAEYGSIEVARKKNSEDRVSLSEQKKSLDAEKVSMNEKLAEIAKDRKDLDATTALYKKKIEDINVAKKQLEEDRKNLESKIIASFTKSLTSKV